MRGPLLAIMLVASALGVAAAAAAPTLAPPWRAWLCFPGPPDDWCSVGLTTTVVAADGARHEIAVSVPRDPPLDCFYVYPTVSEEMRPNSNLVVEPQERAVAITQAARFSHVCRVYAPMYNQVTVYAGACSTSGRCIKQGDYGLEYTDVLAAWRSYVRRYNDGSPFVLVGHSEGAFILERLLASVIERRQFVSAILLGGDVEVDAHDRYDGVPACASLSQTGCIVTYSSWDHTPPADARFQSVSSPSEHVLCVNPAAPAGGSAAITPIFGGIAPEGIVPDTSAYVAHPWVKFPGLYSARCVRRGTRAWLLVTRIHTPGDRRPTLQPVLPPSWGLHAADVNIALANLVELVAAQTRAWLAHH